MNNIHRNFSTLDQNNKILLNDSELKSLKIMHFADRQMPNRIPIGAKFRLNRCQIKLRQNNALQYETGSARHPPTHRPAALQETRLLSGHDTYHYL